MSTEIEKKESYVRSGLLALADTFEVNISQEELYNLLVNSAFGGKNPSHVAMASFLTTAVNYKLNPFNKEIYAFEKGGKTHTIIAIDGWLKIAHATGELRGIKHEIISDDKGNVIAVKCILARHGWEFYTETVEYMKENNRNTNVWKEFPVRMLKHRATAQAIRMAFNVNAMLEDEYEAMSDEKKVKEKIVDNKNKAERAKKAIWASSNVSEVQNIFDNCRETMTGLDLIDVENVYNERMGELGVINA